MTDSHEHANILRSFLASFILAVVGGASVWVILLGFLEVHGDEIGVSSGVASPIAMMAALLIGAGALFHYLRPQR